MTAIGVVAQLGEHLPCTQGVGSSILPGSTKKQQPINIDESVMVTWCFGLYESGKLIKNMVKMCVHKAQGDLKKK